MRNTAGNDYKILERKSSNFGRVGIQDRQSGLQKMYQARPMAYYEDLKRKEAYLTCIDRYNYDQLARPIINMIVHATMSTPPDFQGDEGLVKDIRKLILDSNINWITWGIDLETYGDLFIRSFTKGNNPKLASIPPESIDIEYDQRNILDIKKYVQFKDDGGDFAKGISPDEMTHIKINCASSQVYGVSTLRPVLWWLDVLDNLWERNWIRAAQYYGNPIVAVTGIPGEHIETVKATLQADGQRPGRNWVFPPDVKAETLDFTKNYPIQDLIDRVYQYILAACGIPQHLVYESDSSRGVAMFSADGFEMMIKSRRRTWEIGLRRALQTALNFDNEIDLKINWAPVFMRDLKNLSSLVDTMVTQKVISKHTARELINVDHSVELERMKQQKKDEPDEMESAKISSLQNKMALPPKAKVGK